MMVGNEGKYMSIVQGTEAASAPSSIANFKRLLSFTLFNLYNTFPLDL